MYRNYINTCLDVDKLKEINRNSPANTKYCNFLCQDFRDSKTVGKQRSYCNDCRNYINLAEKQFAEKKITIEQFKENPDIVYGIEIVIDTKRECITCKQNKTTNHFEKTRTECKACRSIKIAESNNKGIDTLISDINKIKDVPVSLENFLQAIPKDKLTKIISHFAVGRKATDTKNDMIYNCLQHFKKLRSPFICRGTCGFTLPTEFSYCKTCLAKKDKPKAVEVMFNFDDSLDEIVSNLTDKDNDIGEKYNREQCYKIAAKLGLKIKQKTKKNAVVEKINALLKKRSDEKKKKRDSLLLDGTDNDPKYELTFNGINIKYRKEDGFVNATSMCKAGKKEFYDWKRLENTKELIKALEESQNLTPGYNGVKIIDTKEGRYGGSWIHPDLAVQLAQWISPKFALQVSRWIRELAVTGSVRIGMEKTDNKILELQNALTEQIIENKKIKKDHQNVLYKRQYHKFHKGAAFYIVSKSDENDEYKIGFDGEDINERFRGYRTFSPKLKVHYVVYTNKAKLLEELILTRLDSKKLEKNHEVLINVELEQLITDVETTLLFLNIQKTILSNEELDKYNQLII
jgi:hypothetical protein